MRKQFVFLAICLYLVVGCHKSSGKKPIVQPESSEQPNLEELSLVEVDGQPLGNHFSANLPFVLQEDELLIFDSAKDCIFDQHSSSGISCSLRDISTVAETMEDLRTSDSEVFGLYAGICNEDGKGVLSDSFVIFKSEPTLFSLTGILTEDEIDLEKFVDFNYSKDLSATTANRCKIAFLGGINIPDVLDVVPSLDIEMIIRDYHYRINEIEKLDNAILAKVTNAKNSELLHVKLRGLSRVAKELHALRKNQITTEIPDEEFTISATLCNREVSSMHWGFESKLAFWSLPNSENCRVFLEIEESYRTEGSSIPVVFRYKDSEGIVLEEEETYFFSLAIFNHDRWGSSFRDFPLEARNFEVEILKIKDSKLMVYRKEIGFKEPNSVDLDFDFIEEAELISVDSETAEVRYRLNPALMDIAPHSNFDLGDLWVCFTKSDTPLTPLEMAEQGKGACGIMFGFLYPGRFSFTESHTDFGRFGYWNSTLFDEEVNAYLYSEEVQLSTFEPRAVFYSLGKVKIPRVL